MNLVPNNSLSMHLSRSMRPELIQSAIATGHIEQGTESFHDAVELLLNEFKKRGGGLKPHSMRSLSDGWNAFLRWCIANNVNSLPAKSETVESYMVEKSYELHRNTLASRRWAISKIHAICNLPNPFDSEWVKMTIKEINRRKIEEEDELIEQASAFREYHLDQLESMYKHGTLKQKRDLLMITIAYESMLRASELARIKLRHINFKLDKAVITIPVTKTNHSGHADTVSLSVATSRILKQHIDEQGIIIDTDGYLFRPLRRNGKIRPTAIRPLSTQAIIDVFEQAWLDLGGETLLCDRWSTHAARVGAAQDLLAAGYSIAQIQQAGRWREATMIYRYGRGILTNESAMSSHRANKL